LAETTLEFVKRHLDSEMESEGLHQLPSDFYSRVSQYSQKLRRSAGSGNSDVSLRLISKQAEMIGSMTRQLLGLRAKKAAAGASFLQLLPEERYVCLAQQSFQRRFDAFIEALSAGRPAYIEFAHRSESARNMTVRFVRHTKELVGADLKRYGPFEENDVASLPAASAAILISGGDAVEVYVRQAP
jgi:DNA replication initiation complex subunit (GINS family)